MNAERETMELFESGLAHGVEKGGLRWLGGDGFRVRRWGGRCRRRVVWGCWLWGYWFGVAAMSIWADEHALEIFPTFQTLRPQGVGPTFTKANFL